MNTPKLATLTFLAFAVLQLSGCAMVKSTGSSASASASAAPAAPTLDNVSISSTPPGAMISLDGNDVGVTPQVLSLDRSHSYLLAVKQPGFYYYTQTLKVAALATGDQTDKLSAQFPVNLDVWLSPVQNHFYALEVAVAKLDYQIQMRQISQDAYKQQLVEVTGLYR